MQNFTVNPGVVDHILVQAVGGDATNEVRTMAELEAVKEHAEFLTAVVLWDDGTGREERGGDWEVPVSWEEAEFILKVKAGDVLAWLVTIEGNELQTVRA